MFVTLESLENFHDSMIPMVDCLQGLFLRYPSILLAIQRQRQRV